MFLPVLNKTRCCSTAVTKSLAPGIGNSQQVQKIRLFIVALRRHDSLGPPWSSRPRHDMSCISCVQLRFRIRPKLRDNYWAFFAMPSQLQAIRRTVVNPLMGFLQFYTPIIRMFMDFCYGMTIPRIHTYTIPCFDRSKCETYGSLDDLCVSIARWSGPAKRM